MEQTSPKITFAELLSAIYVTPEGRLSDEVVEAFNETVFPHTLIIPCQR